MNMDFLKSQSDYAISRNEEEIRDAFSNISRNVASAIERINSSKFQTTGRPGRPVTIVPNYMVEYHGSGASNGGGSWYHCWGDYSNDGYQTVHHYVSNFDDAGNSLPGSWAD